MTGGVPLETIACTVSVSLSLVSNIAAHGPGTRDYTPDSAFRNLAHLHLLRPRKDIGHFMGGVTVMHAGRLGK